MTLLFDGSIIGYSLLRPQYRTGIYRVAVALLEALSRQPYLEVLVYSSSGNQVLVARALGRAGLGRSRVVGSRFWGSLSFAALTARNLSYRAGWPRFSEFCSGVQGVFEGIRARADRKLLTRAEGYLSPMEAAPDFIRNLPHLRLSFLVHDLIPLVLADYRQDPTDPTKWFSKFIRSLRPGDNLFTVSEFTRQDFLRLFPHWSPDRLVVAHNAVEPGRFAPGPVNPGPPYFLTVSTIEPRKRIDTIAEAFGRYRQSGGQARLVVCGANREDHQHQVLDRLFPEIRPFVDFTGYVEDAALPAYYRSCLAFLYLSEYEGFGLPVLEAMTCGAPVVVSDRTSLPEVAGEAGVYVSPEDPVTLAGYLTRLESDPAWRQGLAQKSLTQASRFSWDSTAAILGQKL